ncbi:MAG: hypothetical protein GF401_04165 [Chitinivibrionales bacterium]|nr:hypothetical protein [Chitinivibrionales bacterium]
MQQVRFLVSMICLAGLIGCSSKQSPPDNRSKFDESLDALAGQIVKDLSTFEKKVVALRDFAHLEGKITQLGRFIAEELTTRLYRTGRFEIIERQLLHRTMHEHKLNMMSMVDQQSAVKLGRLIGAQVIASGSLTDLGSSIKVNARLVDTENGKVFSVASVTIPKTTTVASLMSKPLKDGAFNFGRNASQERDNTNGKKGAAQEMSPTASSVPSAIDKLTKDGFTLSVRQCARTIDGTVTCTLTIENTNEKDREFAVQYGYPSTRMFDNLGNEYRITAIDMANKSYRFRPMGSSYQEMRKLVVAGVPLTTVLTFENVSQKASEIALLEINCGRDCLFKFRNLSLEEQ